MRTVFWIIAFGLLALELVGIYQLWLAIGAWTLVWLALAMVAGVWLLRREQRAFVPQLKQALANGHTPFGLLLASLRRMIAALLLIFPGIVSDGLALFLLAWPGAAPPKPRAGNPPPTAGEVIEGEYRRID